ncbi:MAG: hypothetical protein BMS9Abin11_1754 [Gammaproteobacteria bacterium]|nr:MAG: hypothetical protein BMS9Abin11_1754 [Gammaproteobacteria bacterium]
MGTDHDNKVSATRKTVPAEPHTFARARETERVWASFMELELQMIGARSLYDLLSIVVLGLSRKFPNVAGVTLSCIDDDYEMRRMLEIEAAEQHITQAFVPVGPRGLGDVFGQDGKPFLGLCKKKFKKRFFPNIENIVGSAAITPLYLRGKLIGSINQASINERHFHIGVGTDFLEHMATVLAMCIDNVINHERLKIDCLTDGLTGIFNRRFFEQRLHDEIERWERTGRPLSCMFVDIDFFKQVNDNHGHQVGDRVLQQVARVLGSELRSSDILARYGGEEFVLLLSDTSQVTAAKIADRLRSLVENMKLKKLLGVSLNVSISIGLAVLSDDYQHSGDQSPSEWLTAQADKALYQAKGSGRNRVIVAAHS